MDFVSKIKKFAFTNKAGGTGLSDWAHHPNFTGTAEVRIVKGWHDYEIGYRFIGEAVSNDLQSYLEQHSSSEDRRVFIGEADFVNPADMITAANAFVPLRF